MQAPTPMKKRNLKGLQLPSARAGTATTNNSVDALGSNLSRMSLNIDFKLDLHQEDLKVISELGYGNGGTVSKVMHLPTHTLMAKKVIKIEAKAEARKRILRELQIMHDCNSPYIVGFYGAYINDNDIHVCMEHMDCTSLDSILAKKGKLPLDVLGKIAYSVIEGLTYLYDVHRIIHRDIKPSNVLVNSTGKVKLCDFGVSGELINSIANTFVGTSTYMSPERIQGAAYSVKGDVWSLGLLLVELSTGKFPFGSGAMGVLDLLQLIVREPAPQLNAETYGSLSNMVSLCLKKDPADRASLSELLNCEFISEARKKRVDMAKWAKSTQSFKRNTPGTTLVNKVDAQNKAANSVSANALASPLAQEPRLNRSPAVAKVADSGPSIISQPRAAAVKEL